MNTEIHNAFLKSLAADASYVNGLIEGDKTGGLSEKLSQRLTPDLATYVGDNFKVVTQWTDPGASGLSVTVFEDRAQQKFIAFRGTETDDKWRDFTTDANAYVGSGLAKAQVVAMINWHLRASAKPGTKVPQVTKWEQSNQFGQAVSLVRTADAVATGELFGNSGLQISGHSLGGHLTTVFSRLFGNMVQQSATFNGLGIGYWLPEDFLRAASAR